MASNSPRSKRARIVENLISFARHKKYESAFFTERVFFHHFRGVSERYASNCCDMAETEHGNDHTTIVGGVNTCDNHTALRQRVCMRVVQRTMELIGAFEDISHTLYYYACDGQTDGSTDVHVWAFEGKREGVEDSFKDHPDTIRVRESVSLGAVPEETEVPSDSASCPDDKIIVGSVTNKVYNTEIRNWKEPIEGASYGQFESMDDWGADNEYPICEAAAKLVETLAEGIEDCAIHHETEDYDNGVSTVVVNIGPDEDLDSEEYRVDA